MKPNKNTAVHRVYSANLKWVIHSLTVSGLICLKNATNTECNTAKVVN